MYLHSVHLKQVREIRLRENGEIRKQKVRKQKYEESIDKCFCRAKDAISDKKLKQRTLKTSVALTPPRVL